MNRKSHAGWLRPAPLIVLALASLTDCATRSASIQCPPPARRSGDPDGAPDLLNVSTVAPGINAGPAAGEPRRPVGPRSSRRPSTGPGIHLGQRPPGRRRSVAASALAGSTPRPVLRARATAVASASIRPAGRLERVRPPQAGRRTLDAGLMGPTPPISASAASTPPTIPQSVAPFPIDLSAALRLADRAEPGRIGEARILILGALAERQAARALLLPYLNAGTNYHDHTGPVERSNGQILILPAFLAGASTSACGPGPWQVQHGHRDPGR